MRELRGLGAVERALRERGGSLLAISVDAPADSRRVALSLGLPFRILSDAQRGVTALFGLVHAGGSPDGSDVPVPAQFLIRRDRTIAWRHVARRILDRADPAAILAQVRAL